MKKQLFFAAAALVGFYAAADGITVTFTFPELNGNEVVITSSLAEGTDVSNIDNIPSLDFFTATGVSETSTTVRNGNCTFNVTGTWAFPITDFDKVYHLSLNKNEIYYDGKMSTNATSTTGNFGSNFWYFKNAGFENGRQKVTLHNIAAGTDKGVYMETGDNAKGTFTDTPTTYYVVYNSNNTDGFSLNHYNNSSSYINYQGIYLSTWTENAPNDNGSSVRIKELTDDDFSVSDDLENINESDSGEESTEYDFFTYTYSYDYKYTVTYNTDNLETAKSSHSITDVASLVSASLSVTTTESAVANEGYYTIKSNANNRYIYSAAYADANGTINDDEDNARLLQKRTHTDGQTVSVDEIWYAQKVDGYDDVCQLISPISNSYYMSQRTGTGAGIYVTKESQDGGTFKINNLGEGKCAFQFMSSSDDSYTALNLYINDWGGWSNTNDLGAYTSLTDSGHSWWVEKVTEVSYTIDDDANYGTVCFPFAVTIPSGVTAYIADYTQTNSSDDNDTNTYVHLSAISETIPANTAVIVTTTSTDKTITFPIVTETTSAQTTETSNILTGVTLQRQGLTAESFYSLSGDKFVKDSEATTAAATSAILETSKLTDTTNHNVNELTLTTKSYTTGIAEINADSNTGKVFFDLNGRRVENPSRGIYVTSDGEKVLIF